MADVFDKEKRSDIMRQVKSKKNKSTELRLIEICHADGHFGEFKAYTCNRYMTGGKAVCSSRYINYKVLTQLLLLDIRCKATLAQNGPDTLRETYYNFVVYIEL